MRLVALLVVALLACRTKDGSGPRPGPAAEARAVSAPIVPSAPSAVTEPTAPIDAPALAAPFVERYVAGWSLRDRPASSIPLGGVTDVVLFSVLPRQDGTIDQATNGLTDARIAALRGRAPRTLVAIGGERSASRFRSPEITASLAAFVDAHQLDGVVLDIEPLAGVEPDRLVSLVRSLARSIAPRPVRAVVAPDRAEIARLAPVLGDLERIAIMSYLDETRSAEDERALVRELTERGFDRSRIALGVGPRTSPAARCRRAKVAGGVILWGTTSTPGDR